jgi:hypothetical protein
LLSQAVLPFSWRSGDLDRRRLEIEARDPGFD